MMNYKRKALAFALISLSLMLVVSIVDAHSAGKTGSSTSGCTCHGVSPSSAVTVTISGLPPEYSPATKYTLTVIISGGPSPGGSNKGGFDMSATQGFLTAPSGASDVQVQAGEATHTTAGNDQRSWQVEWTAPATGSGPATLNVAGNSVNGDGAPTGDQWNTASYTVPEAVSIDTASPTITITSPTEGQEFPEGTATVQVTGKASDNVALSIVEVSTDGAKWAAASGKADWSATIPVQGGANTVQARATDTSNNKAIVKVNFTVKVPPADVTAPSISITSPTAGQAFPPGTLSVAMSGTASDNIAVAKVEVSTDGVSWSTADGTSSWTHQVSVQSGQNTLHARARDAAGNSKEAQVDVTVDSPVGDSTPPVIAISYPPDGKELPDGTTGTTVRGTASDNTAIDRVEVSTDDHTWALAKGNASWSADVKVTIGDNIVLARAIDPAGNSARASVHFTVASPPPPPDKTPPNVTIISPVPGARFPFGTTSITLLGRAQDEDKVQEVRVSVNGGTFEKAIGTADWSFDLTVESGPFDIEIEAQDPSGNIGRAVTNFSVDEDTTPPTLVITSHSGNVELRAGTKSIRLYGIAADPAGIAFVDISTDNRTWDPATGTEDWSKEVSVRPGTNTFYVRVTDAHGNEAFASVTVKVLEEKANLWPAHVVLQVIAMVVGVGIWASGWRIRRAKGKEGPEVKRKRRRGHILLGPVFMLIIVGGFMGGLWNRWQVRGVVLSTAHGYLGLATVIIFAIGGALGAYMAMRRPTDTLRRVHLVLQTLGLVLFVMTIAFGTFLVGALQLLG